MASSFVRTSKASSTYPTRGKSCLGSSGRVGEKRYACGAFFGCSLAGQRFEQPRGIYGSNRGVPEGIEIA